VQKGEPRYRRIQRDLEDRLSRGLYPVGSLLPTEADLGFEFKASRFTVREALRKLTELGYV
jgi:GntR family transcriptional regulator